MDVYHDPGRTYTEPRPFPYKPGTPDQSGYVDFKQKPELIQSVLEDFRPYAQERAIQTFYSFLAWANSTDSHLETNDCVFRPPTAHKDSNSDLKLATHGRLILMYRNLQFNCSSAQADWLCGKLMQILRKTDPGFTARFGVVGFTLNPALQLALSKAILLPTGLVGAAIDDPGMAQHLMLTFWAYGNDESEAFASLDRLFRNIWAATKELSAEIDEGIRQQSNQVVRPNPTS